METALAQAVRTGSLKIAGELLQRGAHVEDGYQTPPWNRPLYHAVESGHDGIIELLLQNGADVQSLGDGGDELLWLAGRFHKRIRRMLSDAGARPRPQRPNNKAQWELDEAINTNDAAQVEHALAEGADPSWPDDIHQTPLHDAALNGLPVVVQLLIRAGADVNTMSRTGRTPLHFAVEEGHIEVVEALLDAGADLSAKDRHGKYALLIALEEERLEVAKLLVARGATAQGPDALLHEAVKQESHDWIRTLVSLGADLAFRDESGHTPLERAVYSGSPELVELLLACGASDADGSAMEIAEEDGCEDIIRLFQASTRAQN